MSQEIPAAVLAVDETTEDDRSVTGSVGPRPFSGENFVINERGIESCLVEHQSAKQPPRLSPGEWKNLSPVQGRHYPNDEQEKDRLDLQHQIWLLSLNDRLGVAPPCQVGAKVGRVLDVGAGTGIWALNFGDEHPEAEVLGNDLSPIMPGYVPPNVKFEIDDIEEEWTFSRPFEYIHSRVMTASINDWTVYLRRCYDNLEPGGYLELQEIDIMAKSDDETLKPDSALNKWGNLIHDASEKLGRPFISVASLKALMIDAGFQDVTVTTLKWPTNGWPKDRTHKELGYWQNDNILAGAGIEALSLAPLTRAFDWSRAEIEVFLIDVRKDINNRAIHAYWPACCVVGRKPLKEDKPAEA